MQELRTPGILGKLKQVVLVTWREKLRPRTPTPHTPRSGELFAL